MRHVRELTPEELEESLTLSANAYPGLELASRVNRVRYRERVSQLDQDQDTHFYGLFEEGEMRGVMRWHDFTMNLFGEPTLVGGLGGVAVDLLHKKEKIAADMVRAFLDHYRKAGAALTALYPFRPDFYRRMGFGYGTPTHFHHFLPASLPTGASKTNLGYLGKEDRQRIHDCYHRYFRHTHGIMARKLPYWDHIFNEATIQVVGVDQGSRLAGYVAFSFDKGKQDNFLSNTLHIRELVYETAGDLEKLLTFLHTQADQVEAISYNTQDEDFFYLLQDPRQVTGAILPKTIAHETSARGLGIMYRVLDVDRLFEVLEKHNFGGVSCRLRITLTDSFLPDNAGSYDIDFVAGKARPAAGAPAEVSLSVDVAEFSALVIGAVKLEKLVEYGLATLSDEAYIERLGLLFNGPKPICLTSF